MTVGTVTCALQMQH